MKNHFFKFMAVVAVAAGLLVTHAAAQSCQTDPFTITNDGDINLQFQDFSSLAQIANGVSLTLTVTGVTASGTLQGTSPTPVDPQVTFTDVISLHNVNYPPANLTETDNYVGSTPIVQNEPAPFTADAFEPIPNSSNSVITATLPNADLANFVGNGTFDLDIVSQLTTSNFVGANNPNMTYTVTGSAMICPVVIAAPEPSAWLLAGCALGAFAFLRCSAASRQ